MSKLCFRVKEIVTKNSMDEFNSELDVSDGRICELEVRVKEISQTAAQIDRN